MPSTKADGGGPFYCGSRRRDLNGVFNKDVKVPLQEVELVGTSSFNKVMLLCVQP